MRLFRVRIALGVRQKILLVLLSALLIALTINNWFALQSQKHELLRDIRRHGTETTQLVGQYLSYSTISYDYHTIRLVLNRLVSQHVVTYAQVRSRRGNIMAQAGHNGPSVALFSAPIQVGQSVVGSLTVGLSTNKIAAQVQADQAAFFRRQLWVMLSIAVVEMMALSLIIIRPLRSITGALRTTRSVSDTLALPDALPVPSGDEIGQIAREFNSLREMLLAAHKQLYGRIEAANSEVLAANQMLRAQSLELERINKELQQLSVTDALTGLYNRRHFEYLMETEIGLSLRGREPLSILMLDLDRFKEINDRHGHHAGDAFLKHVATLISGRVRKTDAAGRFGGDEFFILCRRASSSQARVAADGFLGQFRSHPFRWQEHEIPVSASIGVATILGDTPVTPQGFFQQADRAMYRAKHSGGDQVCTFSEDLWVDEVGS